MRSILSLVPLAALCIAREHQPGAQIPLNSPDIPPQEPLTLDAIPLLGFGTWNLQKGDNATAAVSCAIQAGYRHIDCAAAYGNEVSVGKGISDGLQKAGLSRSDIWVTSKLWNDHHDPTLVESAIDTTLHHLGLDYLDLYHMHWPVAQRPAGNKIDYLDTWGAMAQQLGSGKTRHIGVCNFDRRQLEDLLAHTAHAPSVHQMELHPYLQQRGWLRFHAERGIRVTAYSPLAGSNPAYEAGEPVPLLANPAMRLIAAERGCSAAQVALAWGMGRGTSVIPKSCHAARITENWLSRECGLEGGDYERIAEMGEEYSHRYNNPSRGWGVELYEGLEDGS